MCVRVRAGPAPLLLLLMTMALPSQCVNASNAQQSPRDTLCARRAPRLCAHSTTHNAASSGCATMPSAANTARGGTNKKNTATSQAFLEGGALKQVQQAFKVYQIARNEFVNKLTVRG